MNRMQFVLVGAALAVVTVSAAADVRHVGVWPSDEKKVSLDLDHAPRNQAVQKLSDGAGWSLVAQGVGTDPVEVHIKDQPPGKVLDVLLADGDWVAERDGTLVRVTQAPSLGAAVADAQATESASAVDAAAVAASPLPVPSVRGEDRKLTGGNLRVEKGEIVHNVSVVGGNLDVFGTVTGKVSLMGGTVRVHDGAHVLGNVTCMGGTVHVDDGAVVDGDVAVAGGSLKRGEKSKIGGSIEIGQDDESTDEVRTEAEKGTKKGPGLVRRVGNALTSTAMLFAFGAVLLALAGRKMEELQTEVAARPMRSFAFGIVGALGFLVGVVALVVTLVGIPVAALVLFGGVLAMYAAFCAVLATLGRALVKHKTGSPYAHLAVGCLLFLVAGHLPVVGDLATLVLGLVGIGTLVATRAAGLWPGKGAPQDPYRTAA